MHKVYLDNQIFFRKKKDYKTSVYEANINHIPHKTFHKMDVRNVDLKFEHHNIYF